MSNTPDQTKDSSALKRALFALKDMRAKLDAVEHARKEPIAIVSMACRLPGSCTNPEALWMLLRDGVDAISEVPADRWDIDAFYDPNPSAPGKMTTRHGGFIDQVDQFDPQFFSIAPREAVCMDPQQRLMLEVAWEALEHAGMTSERVANTRTGVFLGMGSNDYGQLQLSGGDPADIDAYFSTGNAGSAAAGRISYVLGLQGPSMVIDTACSSSLMAVHLACQSLRNRECSMALAGGVNLILVPSGNIALSKIGMLAPDGRCKTFDARADGFARGEGCGMVVLKRLSDALADGDPILALVRGTAANQDGRSAGMTAPNGLAQQAVIREALANGGIQPHEVGYVEAHGTGTSLGDPIEVQALNTVFSEGRDPSRPLLVGSIKTNIGHLEAAAGIVGLMKAVLTLHRQQIPPHLHLQERNQYIPWESMLIDIPTSLQAWPQGYDRPLAGISSFGASGTNVHVVLEAAPAQEPAVPPAAADQLHVLALSAHTPGALKDMATAYSTWMRSADAAGRSVRDICYTASLRRTHHEYRLASVGASHTELIEQLDAFSHDESRAGTVTGRVIPGRRRKLVFVFSGQGAQWAGMGRELLEREPVFSAVVDQCDALFRAYGSWSIREELSRDAASSRLGHTEIAQPALFTVQVALAALWRSWGIEPRAVVGHSIGEAAAAYVAGALSLEDAARLVFYRGRLMEPSRGQGDMASIEVAPEELEDLLVAYKGRVSIAAINSPSSTVIAGEPAAVTEIVARIQERQIFCRALQISYAFHSPQMDPFQPQMVDMLSGLKAQETTIPLYSTVMGQLCEGTALDATYWGRNIREPVRFAAAIEVLTRDGYDLFLEVGPHPVLRYSLRQCLERWAPQGSVLASMRRDVVQQHALLTSLGQLFTEGYAVDWRLRYPAGGQLVPAPTYPWQRERFWVESRAQQQRVNRSAWHARQQQHPLLGTQLELASGPGIQIWESEIDARMQPTLFEYKLNGSEVLPISALVEAGLSASRAINSGEQLVLSDLILQRQLALTKDAESVTPLQVTLTPASDGATTMRLHSRQAEQDWLVHACATLHAQQPAPEIALPTPEELKARCPNQIEVAALYATLAQGGVVYGSAFQVLSDVWQGSGEALGHIEPTPAHEQQRYALHPRLIEACMQVAGVALAALLGEDTLAIPVGLDHAWVSASAETAVRCYAAASTTEKGELRCDAFLQTAAGEVVAVLQGIHLQELDHHHAQPLVDPLKEWIYQLEWLPQPQVISSEAPGKDIGGWLIFSDAQGVGAALVEQLRQRGAPVVVVTPGATYARLTDAHYQVRTMHPEDIRQVVFDIRAAGWSRWGGVVHLWGIDAMLPAHATSTALLAAQSAHCGSLIHLVQGLSQAEWTHWPKVWVVTQNSLLVDREHSAGLNIAQAPLWGLGRVVAVEHHELWGGMIDLDGGMEPQQAAEMLLSEISNPTLESQLAVRAGQRYVARLVRSSPTPAAQTLTWRPDASYLITGGLGDVGLRIARWMVQQGARRLILMGRTTLPPRSAWKEVPADSHYYRMVTAVRELEAMGASIHLAAVDVADEVSLRMFLDGYRREDWPPIRGVVHAAGVLMDRMILQLGLGALEAVMRPKVLGGWLLHRLLADTPLDFFVLFSAMGAVLGTPGLANYAASNTFLDALAYHRRTQGLPALSVNWGAWEGLGFAASDGAQRLSKHISGQGLGSMPPDQAVEIFGHLLSQPESSVAVAPIHWAKFAETRTSGERLLLTELLTEQTETGTQKAERPSIRTLLQSVAPGREQIELLETHLQEQVAKVLQLPVARIELHQPLGTLGFDSIMNLELRNRLEASLELTLPATLMWNYPTTAALAEHLAGKLGLFTPTTEAAAQEVADDTSDFDDLSDAEAEALLAEKLASLDERI